ncbi:MAG TPA: hypothetical protein VKQ32_23845 [Polyangia bacterium]|nr:hypothetical protein [Polyangia bacterium]
MKQTQSVEIAYLMSGSVVSQRRLSRRGEWRAAASAFAMVAGMSVASALLVGVALLGAHRVVYATAYFGVWAFASLAAAGIAAVRAAQRARCYGIGASIDDDAFAGAPLPLVRRTPRGYVMRLAPGMTGQLESGRAPIPLESVIGEGVVDVPLPADARAEIQIGPAMFVVRSGPDRGGVPALPAGVLRRFARKALLPLQLAALASLLCAVRIGAQISDAEMKSAIPADATPMEVELALRKEAQLQASSLHQCFDVMPISCQRRGYVGVGLSLSREGEIRTHKIVGSSYGADCPVNQCLSDVVGSWFFEPLPQSMTLVLPVQVLRTDKPLPYGPARAAADVERQKARSAQTSLD